METIYIILGLIMLVFGILQIILFFKLWKMTNEVHAIKENKPVDKNTPEDTFWELRKYILIFFNRENIHISRRSNLRIGFEGRHIFAHPWTIRIPVIVAGVPQHGK